jgi:hypothetical protein
LFRSWFALPLVADELVHVPGGEHPGVVASAEGCELQEGTQLQPGAPGVVEGAAGARAGRGPQDVGEVVPDEVAQPPLGYAGQVNAAGTVAELAPEVLGQDVAGLAGLRRRDVEGVQAAGDGGGDAGSLPPGRRAQTGVSGVQQPNDRARPGTPDPVITRQGRGDVRGVGEFGGEDGRVLQCLARALGQVRTASARARQRRELLVSTTVEIPRRRRGQGGDA